jgi:hypothetical protein
MEIKSADLTGYFLDPPAPSAIAGEALDERRGKPKGTLVVVASYRDSARLRAMLGALASQSFRDFDVAVIYGQGDNFVRARGISAVHVKRKTDLGFAGAVYLGQCMALAGGYEYFMALDVDRLPARPDSFALLHREASKSGSDYVAGGLLGHGFSTTNFLGALVRTRLLLKAGLYALPLYLGFEDIEFHYRLTSSGAKFSFLPQATSRIEVTSICSLPSQEFKLLGILSSGGRDSTYFYSDLLGNCLMPESLFLPRYPGGARGFFGRVLFAAKRFFLHGLKRRMLELRIPETARYARDVAAGRFEVLSWSDPDCALLSDSAREDLSPPQYLRELSLAKKPLLHAILRREAAGFQAGAQVFLYDSCLLFDPCKKRKMRLEWKRKAGFAQKAACAACALMEAALLVAKGMRNIAAGRHLFKGYGCCMARKLAESSRRGPSRIFRIP